MLFKQICGAGVVMTRKRMLDRVIRRVVLRVP
jgi:hypothetical protein